MYTEGGGGGIAVSKNSIADSTNETEHRILTQYREEVFYNTNLEQYKTLTNRNQSCQGKNAD